MKKFRDITDSEIAELVRFIADGGKARYRPHLNGVDVVCTQDFIDIHGYYEIPKRPMSIDWSALKDEFVCAAREKSNDAYAYDCEPNLEKDYWTAEGLHAGQEGLHAGQIDYLKSYDPGTVDWTESLIWRPGHKPK